METLVGTGIGVYVTVTVILVGFAAYMTGQALANTWRPYWHLIVYCALLGCASRFLLYALFEGRLFSPVGYAIDTGILIVIGSVAFRLSRARKMVSQYPWLYRRAGVFGWRKI